MLLLKVGGHSDAGTPVHAFESCPAHLVWLAGVHHGPPIAPGRRTCTHTAVSANRLHPAPPNLTHTGYDKENRSPALPSVSVNRLHPASPNLTHTGYDKGSGSPALPSKTQCKWERIPNHPEPKWQTLSPVAASASLVKHLTCSSHTSSIALQIHRPNVG